MGTIGSVLSKALAFLQQRSKWWSVLASLALVVAIGLADYASGFERSLLVFYVLPVAIGTWFVSWQFAVLLCLLSIAVWLGGDIAAGAVYSSSGVLVWNAAIVAAFFLLVVLLLTKLRRAVRDLESRVQRRTAALAAEVAMRKQLEQAITEAGDRERTRIGHELHDSVCQHLAATSMALQVLSGKLATDAPARAADADRAVEMVEGVIDVTRGIARGLVPLALQGAGLVAALQELSQNTRENYRVACTFKADGTIHLTNATTATHLYNIAQEAVSNAVKHGHISRIGIRLEARDSTLRLTVEDDGIGLPDPLPEKRGLGLQIMAERAEMIGARLILTNGKAAGVRLECELPTARG